MFHWIIFLLLIASSLSWNFYRCAVCFQLFMNIACRSTQNAACIKRFLYSVLYDKNSVSKYCFTSDVMYKKYKRLVYTPPDLLASKLVKRKKFDLICFPRICFLGLIYRNQEPLCLLNVIEDDCYFLCVNEAINSM